MQTGRMKLRGGSCTRASESDGARGIASESGRATVPWQHAEAGAFPRQFVTSWAATQPSAPISLDALPLNACSLRMEKLEASTRAEAGDWRKKFQRTNRRPQIVRIVRLLTSRSGRSPKPAGQLRDWTHGHSAEKECVRKRWIELP